MSAEFDSFALAAPQLSWREHDLPYSDTFQDTYFSADGGLEESEYVFLGGNNLPEAWRGARQFVVSELGFGTGLNFLLTLEKWRRTSNPASKLFYLSFEAFPLDVADIRRALRRWPSLEALREELLAELPPRFRGLHVLEFGNVRLFLYYMNALDGLKRCTFPVNAWYLDGFAPVRNDGMWCEEIIREISRLSQAGSTLATFSAASEVRRALERNHFIIDKKKGFGRKREMLTAVFGGSRHVPLAKNPRRVLVVGGGLAGASTAAAFSARGASVTLLEREERLGCGASGNASGVLMPHLSVKPDLMSRFYLAGFLQALKRLEQLEGAGRKCRFSPCGVLRLASSERLRKVYSALEHLGLPKTFVVALNKNDASDLSGFDVKEDALFFPSAGRLSPPELIEALMPPEAIRHVCNEALEIRHKGESWEVRSSGSPKVFEAEMLVLCEGEAAGRFAETSWFPLERVRGQVMSVPANERSRTLRHVLCYDGYLLPEMAGAHLLGATYDHENYSREVIRSQNEELLRSLERSVGGLGLVYRGDEVSRVSFRSMSRDRLPFIGPVPQLRAFEDARKEVLSRHWEDIALYPGLYTNVGHGSRGLISTMLGGDLIAAHVFGEPIPLEDDLFRAVHPGRFLARLLFKEMPLTEANLDALKVPHLRAVSRELEA